MHYFLIDFENVSSVHELENIDGIKKGGKAIVFYTKNCKNITLAPLCKLQEHNIKVSFQMVRSGKNALDFQLASYLGYLIASKNNHAHFHIVSCDKDFDCLVSYWKKKNKHVDRIVPGKKQKSSTSKTNSKNVIDPDDRITLKEIYSVLSIEDSPKKILAIANKYSTKQEISNAIAKRYKDSKEAGKIYKKIKPLLKKKHRH